MALDLFYITNDPEIAKICENYSVNRIWVDLEYMNKRLRQPNMNTVLSNHVIADVSTIRDSISKAELMVRVNPIHDSSRQEIDEVIARGADVVMLPFYQSTEEVKKFISYVNGRARVMLLLETIKAEQLIDDYMPLDGIDEVHIGLNDLHLQYHMRFMFELLANGKVETICNALKKYNVKYGFGGIAKLDEGLLPARHIITEHYRLGSQMAILSRSFYDSWISNDYEEIERAFRYGVGEIRDFEKRIEKEKPEFFKKNQETVREEVAAIVKRKA